MVHALMHLPQKQRGIQLVAVRVVEHPFDCPRAQLFDHVRQIVSRLGEGVVRDVRPRARAPWDDAGGSERRTGARPNVTDYTLTEAGNDLADVIKQLGTWAVR